MDAPVPRGPVTTDSGNSIGGSNRCYCVILNRFSRIAIPQNPDEIVIHRVVLRDTYLIRAFGCFWWEQRHITQQSIIGGNLLLSYLPRQPLPVAQQTIVSILVCRLPRLRGEPEHPRQHGRTPRIQKRSASKALPSWIHTISGFERRKRRISREIEINQVIASRYVDLKISQPSA